MKDKYEGQCQIRFLFTSSFDKLPMCQIYKHPLSAIFILFSQQDPNKLEQKSSPSVTNKETVNIQYIHVMCSIVKMVVFV